VNNNFHYKTIKSRVESNTALPAVYFALEEPWLVVLGFVEFVFKKVNN
jgi:hypothetical protein